MDLRLLHIGWSLIGRDVRHACDAFFTDVFAAQTGFEIQMSQDVEGLGHGREESLLVIADTMLIPLAACGEGDGDDAAIRDMLNGVALPETWVGFALEVPDLKVADRQFRELGFEPKYRPGMDNKYFTLDRAATGGVRFEIITGGVPNDPRLTDDWDPNWWRDHHPLGIVRLESVGASFASLAQARAIFGERLGFAEVAQRQLDAEGADCATFRLGDVLLEAMAPYRPDTPLARHARETSGIYCLNYRVKSVPDAAAHLTAKGLHPIGLSEYRVGIDPAEAFGRRIFFVGDEEGPIPGPALEETTS